MTDPNLRKFDHQLQQKRFRKALGISNEAAERRLAQKLKKDSELNQERQQLDRVR